MLSKTYPFRRASVTEWLTTQKHSCWYSYRSFLVSYGFPWVHVRMWGVEIDSVVTLRQKNLERDKTSFSPWR